jgi:DNA-directed RNA polymerase subunit RPC12/RpoP
MSRLVARILLSILMFPLAALFYVVCMFVFDTISTRTSYGTQEVEMFLFAGALTWFGVGIYWCCLWGSSVNLTPRRVGGAILSGVIALGIGILAGLFTWGAMQRGGSNSFAAFVGSVLTIILWLIGTVLAWQETPAERAARIKSSGKSAVACPTCGYNMTGLTEPRCPECGSKFTLDELMAAQVHEAGDVE